MKNYVYNVSIVTDKGIEQDTLYSQTYLLKKDFDIKLGNKPYLVCYLGEFNECTEEEANEHTFYSDAQKEEDVENDKI